MKKLIAFVLAALLLFSIVGCAEEAAEGNNTPNNELFTDACFEGLKQMSLLGYTKALSGEEMQPIIDILQSLTLTAMAEGEYVKENEDAVLLILEYEDGRLDTVQISDTVLCFTAVGSVKHATADNFFADFIKAFRAGEE